MSHVSLSYGSVVALQGVDLTLQAGAFACLIGPNGAGKSTLLRLATGLIKPSGGEIRFEGKPLMLQPRRTMARRVAFVPQNVLLDFPFTVREIVGMGRAPHQGFLGLEGDQDRERVDACLRLMHLQEVADRRLGQISGGEAQRTLVAAALAQEPDLLVLDEPTSHLDIHHQVQLLEALGQLNQERGLTVLLSLHDLNLAALYVPRLILLSHGRVRQDGNPFEVMTPELLREVYDVDAKISPHPQTGVPQVALMRVTQAAQRDRE